MAEQHAYQRRQAPLGHDAEHSSKRGFLRFVTCGSVDDGKSTLIGHMLYDAKLIFADQAQTLELDSQAGAAQDGKLDYSLLLDGLAAEREQGITIDVAYRYFSTEQRSFIVADCPGHEEYTRNMAVGASNSELAVILVDASKGLLPQTYRHVRICSLVGIRHFVFAVNKMDLVSYHQETFDRIKCDIESMMDEYAVSSCVVIPTSATWGDNITEPSDSMLWYQDLALLPYLEQVDARAGSGEQGFTLPVQRVCRPDRTFRGYEGTISSGRIAVGDEVRVLPSGTSSAVERILVAGSDCQEAQVGQAVTLVLSNELDVSRGCVIERNSSAEASSFFRATLLWMEDTALTAGKNYLFKLGSQTVPGMIYEITHRVDVSTGEHLSAKRIEKNEICECKVSLGHKLVYQDFAANRTLGSMILIDRLTNATAAAGIIEHKLNRSDNLTYHEMDITRALREQALGQTACTLWFTGLSGSGKSTLANEVEKRLHARGMHTMLLDGDNVRLGLNRNLGFTEPDRIENIRRIAEVSKLMNDAGLIVLTSFISPFVRDRRSAADIIGHESFVEVYVSTPLEVCEQRDVKGLYAKAREGKIANFTGISSPYEPPEHPAITVDTSEESLEDAAARIVLYVLEQNN
ncbi:MAG: adenylyl-sulfate kinase [Atopobiaceae bacterium]|nr:adenylyl-sulfate kinase [Atopobiaceae bacterium]